MKIKSIPHSGYLVKIAAFKKLSKINYCHRWGGKQKPRQTYCLNCSKPLLHILELNMNDPYLNLGLKGKTIPLLFCWTCEVSQGKFSYRIHKRGQIEVLVFKKGETWKDFPYPDYPVILPEYPAGLMALSQKEQKLIHDQNQGILSAYEYRNDPVVGKPSHQIGGEPYLAALRGYRCPICKRKAPLFCSIGDNAGGGGKFTGNDYVQIIYHLCVECIAVIAYQVCD